MSVSSKPGFFIVGCPRSGTTLLQSLLAAHSQVTSFPESHFFWHLTANRGLWRRKLNLASPQVEKRLREYLCELQREDLDYLIPCKSLSRRQYVKAFVKILDQLTKEQRKSVWIEKTPRHLYCIDDIQHFLPTSKFIHILRKGSDVVASLYEVTQKYPELWKGKRDVDTCIERWKKDIEISFGYSHEQNHILVRYEDLLADTPAAVLQICGFLNIRFEETMLESYKDAAQKVSLANEAWKRSVDRKIQEGNSEKFRSIFNQEQREHIFNQTLSVDARITDELKKHRKKLQEITL